MGDDETGLSGSEESLLGYHSYLIEILTLSRDPARGPWQMGSLTGAGYSADLVARFLKSQGISDALIDLGGNILTVGQNPIRKQPWRIGIQNPVEPRGHHLLALSIENKSIVTSGIYERHLEVDGQSFHHIFDSKTGYPVETDLASITIISDKSVDGEIWTTRLFGESPASILNIVESLPGIDTLLVSQSGKIAFTSGLQSYI